jgi:[acyl-carrier-protein] S-malonyltransferase
MTRSRPVCLLLPGQGAQYPGMAVGLYQREPEFTRVVDAFFDLLGADGRVLRAEWLDEKPSALFDDGTRAQPLLFVLGVAIGRSLYHHGIRPAALLGHSIGELAAAALADVFDLPGAAEVITCRSAALAAAPAGGMLAVAASPDRLREFVDAPGTVDQVAFAGQNAPAQSVLAGPEDRLAPLGAALSQAGLTWRRIPARQAFHSPAMTAAVHALSAAFARIPLAPPSIPIWSTSTAAPVTAAQAGSPWFWARQLGAPVRFWPALDALLRSGSHLLVETGPGRQLSTLARRHASVRDSTSQALALLANRPERDWPTWCAALDQLAELVTPAENHS